MQYAFELRTYTSTESKDAPLTRSEEKTIGTYNTPEEADAALAAAWESRDPQALIHLPYRPGLHYFSIFTRGRPFADEKQTETHHIVVIRND